LAEGGGVVVYDETDYEGAPLSTAGLHVAFSTIARQAGGAHAVHATACGVAASLAGISFAIVADALRDVYGGIDNDMSRADIDVARVGYERGAESQTLLRLRLPPARHHETPAILTGNEAHALGAIRAGCSFYAGYPMNPSTGVMTTMARHAEQFGIVVDQAEDELGAVNMAIGASYAGVRAMTATSGGGLALMGEAVSLSAMTETPLVVLDAQRPAPATGMPTRTEQADLNLAVFLGHGEFARAVYAPGSIEEAYRLTVRAFNVAERYQIPVLLLADQYLAESLRDVAVADLDARVERSVVGKHEKPSGYRRYAQSDETLTPRAIPSWIETPLYVCGEEHDETGHISEDAATRVAMVDRRTARKMAVLTADAVPPTEYNSADAELLLVCFGSTYGVVREVCEQSEGRIGFIHLSQVWPLPPRIDELLEKAKGRVVTIENNAEGQLAQLIRRETGFVTYGSIVRYDGRPFDYDRVLRQVREVEA